MLVTHLPVMFGLVGIIVPWVSSAQSPYPAVPPRFAQEQSPKPQPPAAVSMITVSLKDAPVRDVVIAMAEQAHLRVVYDDTDPALSRRINIQVTNVSIMDAIAKALKGTGLIAKRAPDGETIVIRPLRDSSTSRQTSQKTGTIRGRVFDSLTLQGMRGVSISLQNTSRATLTDERGEFQLTDVPIGDYALYAKILGYLAASRFVTVATGETMSLRVLMIPTPTTLSGVVTTATGVQRKFEIGNVVSSINVDSIMRVAPITSVTDLLETRVPGLTVLRSSGKPGAPARIRIRGTSSLSQSNDPIVIVDGVRMYAAQSDARNGISYNGFNGSVTAGTSYATPSPLDQLDPNSIETIEVFKGPSATAMYGSDAANGVIVVTTRRGRTGPTRWSVSAAQGISAIPGRFPSGLYRFGHSLGGLARNDIAFYETPDYRIDSIVRFQALNVPELTILGKGNDQRVATTLSAGSTAFDYSMTASWADQSGLLKVPEIEAARYRAFHGTEMPGWMRRPDQYGTWSLHNSLGAQVGETGRVTLSNVLFKSQQQQGGLNTALKRIQSEYTDPRQLDSFPYVTGYNDRVRSEQLRMTTTAQGSWRPRIWLPLTAQIGIDVVNRTNEMSHQGGVFDPALGATYGIDTGASYAIGQGRALVQSLNLNATIIHGSWLTFSGGMSGVRDAIRDLTSTTGATPMHSGTSQPSQLGPASLSTTATQTFGWYAEPRLGVRPNLFVTPGFRVDLNSVSGSQHQYTVFPKVNVSWIASEEPSFPLKHLIPLFRPRLALGYAGVQPGVTDRLRTYRWSPLYQIGGDSLMPLGITGAQLTGIGNTRIRPERALEFEGGVDLEVWQSRLVFGVTQYRKTVLDAIVSTPVAPSVIDGQTIKQNVGVVRNTGTEVNVQAQLARSAAFGWQLGGTISRRRNVLVRMNKGFTSAVPSNRTSFTRFVEGYPIFGRWAYPLVRYADANGNGFIDLREIIMGDSAAFIGAQEPNYNIVIDHSMSFLNGSLSLNASMSYEDGMTQMTSAGTFAYLAGLHQSTLAQQAAEISSQSSDYVRVQSVSTFRFHSFSAMYRVPAGIARVFRSPMMSVAIQGSNLGLRTNYRGKDPAVNSSPYSNETRNDGELPQSRTWTFRVTLGN